MTLFGKKKRGEPRRSKRQTATHRIVECIRAKRAQFWSRNAQTFEKQRRKEQLQREREEESDEKTVQEKMTGPNEEQESEGLALRVIEEATHKPQESENGMEERKKEEKTRMRSQEKSQEPRQCGKLGIKDRLTFALIGSAEILIMAGFIAWAFHFITADLI
ncbi:uncharacterized protein LOC103038344 isoform X1 [Astyanax mexicanus]|uniref:uncharacterized protein LOC103038344 isoform X1 n=1 Tax=Astyanax mexicanus TaxID=7994 RepID=UPI0020CB5467|nr:uncharacterized protein LOC103038344 isoform X1 [Astyanax mexicanus]